jgi:hypothetical protein
MRPHCRPCQTVSFTSEPTCLGLTPSLTGSPSNPLVRHPTQPPPHMNLIRNTRMGSPLPPQPTPLTTSTRPLNPSVTHITSLPTPSHSSQRPHSSLSPSSQPTDPMQAHTVQISQRMVQQPRNLTKKGLKQSMNMHKDKATKAAYNTFRVSTPRDACPSAKFPLFQDRVRTKMKAQGEEFWVEFDKAPKFRKDRLVSEVSKHTILF